jgi:hypothetical protein
VPGASRQTSHTEGSDVAYATRQKPTKLREADDTHQARTGELGLRTRLGTPQPRFVADPPAEPGFGNAAGGLPVAGVMVGRESVGRAAMLADEWVRRAAAASVAAALEAGGYDGLTFQSVARPAGLDGDDVRRVFPSTADMVLKALRPAPGSPAGRSAFTLSGETIVSRYLRFWETGDNALILRSLLCASMHDERLAAMMEAHTIRTLIRPFAEDVGATDAYPRARLAVSQLLGLAVSRYLLPQEPLASADIETIAAWAGPALDYCLRGELGRACVPCGIGAARPLEPALPAR